MPRRNRRYTRQFKKHKEKRKPKAKPFETTVIKGSNVTPSGKPASQSTVKSYNWYTCEHWQVPFELEQQLTILASGSRDRPTINEEYRNPSLRPDIGFYLDSTWNRGTNIMTTPGMTVPWLRRSQTQVVMYPWTDFDEPDSIRQFGRVIEWLLDMMRVGKVVETGCLGGHGRTGTLLACLLVAQGMDAWDAILRVRDKYCFQAVESWKQEEFIEEFDARVNGNYDHPNKPVYKWQASRPLAGQQSIAYGHAAYCDSLIDPMDACICGAEDEIAYEEWLRKNNVTLQGGQETDWDRTARKLIEGDADKIAASVMADIMQPLREAQDEAKAAENNEHCQRPPCPFPGECDASVGECWRVLTDTEATTPRKPKPDRVYQAELKAELAKLPPPKGTILPQFDKELGHVVWRDHENNLVYDYSIGEWLTPELVFQMRAEKKRDRELALREAAKDEGASA